MTFMTSSEIREKFIKYFEQHGHKHVESSSLVPANDPTLLFTNAGMVQFKDIFLGKETRNYKRAVTCQRCLRAGGKHNDLENVGYTTRHHTFFEMLGNFSFGDYFKKEAIHYAWDFLTNELKIPSDRLLVTVHEKDSEAEKFWEDEFKASNKFPQSGIIHCGDKDNFWSMGEIGPCGYCSEIFYDHDPDGRLGLKGGKPGDPDEGGERYVEIWNLVFMQFERDSKGNLTPLPKPSVDTGMGLERIAAVLQGVYDNYETDEFVTLYQELDRLIKEANNGANELSQRGLHSTGEYESELKIAEKVVADHVRATVFLVADEVNPSNEGRGYVLRSIIRRAMYHLYIVGAYKIFPKCFSRFAGLFLEKIVEENIYLELPDKINKEKFKHNSCGAAYPIIHPINVEEEKFLETLNYGIKILDNEILKLSKKILSGETVFKLHDTYGFPIILTTEIAKKRGFLVDQAGFETEMEKQRERSRAASKFGNKGELKLAISGETKFVGYDEVKCEAKIIALFNPEGVPVEYLQTNEEGIVILDKTPFYAESGGQVGDTGYLTTENLFKFGVKNTKKYGALILHEGIVECGNFTVNQVVQADIDNNRRTAIKLNHSSAHLLHKALHKVLGDHASQRGSLVDADKLRFDFSHFEALKPEEILTIEKIVNAEIRADLEVVTEIMELDEAKKIGAVALFGEKYGDKVRVVKMGGFSKELCGGTHVKHTGEIGLFKIISESGVAAGTRRIEAVTGENSLNIVNGFDEELKKIAEFLKCNRDQIDKKLQQVFEEKRSTEKELQKIKNDLASGKGKNLTASLQKINGVNVVAEKIDFADAKTLRQAVDNLKQQLEPAVIILASINDDKIQLISGVSKSICDKFNAGELLQHVAKQIDGSGGGRADMAQGGGTNIDALDGALQSVADWLKSKS